MSQNSAQVEILDDFIKRLMKARNSQNKVGFCLSEQEVKDICKLCQEVFRSQPMMLEINAPLHICGDIHGQYVDLLRIFEWAKLPPASTYLFLGDYVDRGQQSLETMCLLFCLKIKFPDHIHLLRGNHEAASVNAQYGFYDECKRKMNLRVWKAFNLVFNYMPVAAVIEDSILCMHGGLSPEMVYLADVQSIERPVDVKNEGIMADLMWSDPTNEVSQFSRNEERGIAQWFGKDAVSKFLDRNGLELICRAHQCVEDGYEFMFDMKLVTVFSAPNYCGEYDNSAAVMLVDGNLTCSFYIFRPLERNNRYEEKVNPAEGEDPTDKHSLPPEHHSVIPGTPATKPEMAIAILDDETGGETRDGLEKKPGGQSEDRRTEPQKLEKRRATGGWDVRDLL